MTTQIEMNESRREIEELLPWYAAGVATPEEARKVEAALAADPELKRSFELVREDQDAVILGNDTLKGPSARAYEKFMAALDAEPARVAPISERMSRGVIGFFESALAAISPRRLAYAGVAAALVVMLQAAVIGGLILREQGGGETQMASTGQQATDRGVHAMVTFAPNASAADIQQALRSAGATIVDGPNTLGQYRVHFLDVAAPADIEGKRAALRAQSNVVRTLVNPPAAR
jgi:anti-sigma factor RsiW